LEETDVLDPLGQENVFLAQPRFGAAPGEAVAAAERWIAGEDEQAICWGVRPGLARSVVTHQRLTATTFSVLCVPFFPLHFHKVSIRKLRFQDKSRIERTAELLEFLIREIRSFVSFAIVFLWWPKVFTDRH
jgi:hypothetical protein